MKNKVFVILKVKRYRECKKLVAFTLLIKNTTRNEHVLYLILRYECNISECGENILYKFFAKILKKA